MTKEFDEAVFLSVAHVAEEKMPHIVAKYIENANIYINTIEGGFEKKDCEVIANAAHPLASSSAALGFLKLSSLARKVENICTAGAYDPDDKAFIEKALTSMRANLEDVKRYGEKFLNSSKKNKVISGDDRKIRVMHIDDDPVICRITKMYLDNAGYFETRSFLSIEKALISASFLPDIILVDFMMPDTQGMESLLSLKADPRLSDIPVVFVTGLDEEVVYDKLGDTISGYMKKPYQPKEMMDYVLRVYDKENVKKSRFLVNNLAKAQN